MEDVVGPGFGVAGRRQEVTAKFQASGIMSFPWRIQMSVGRRERRSDSGWNWSRPAFSIWAEPRRMGRLRRDHKEVEDLAPQRAL